MVQQEHLTEESKPESPGRPLGGKYISIERRSPDDTVFLIDDSPFRSSMPRPTHWSIAWSDLMMTMFILFLCMYVYQEADRNFLSYETPEIIGGSTTEALEADLLAKTGLPFDPMAPGVPLITSGSVDKVEQTALRETEIDAAFAPSRRQRSPREPEDTASQATGSPYTGPESAATLTVETPQGSQEAADAGQYGPLAGEKAPPPRDLIGDIYTRSRKALQDNNLQKFAALELDPGKTVRITLSGDQLFDRGQAGLTFQAIDSLQKIAAAIQQTPYMINIVGHTDNAPMHSDRFGSNWELSLARASAVARFLIDDMNMKPNQFVVSGYSSYRPVAPNTTVGNRAKNRRVEIIITKRLPQPVTTATANLQ